MNPAKCDAVDYIQFLVAAQKRFACSEAARWQPESPQAPAHDAFTRLLRRQPPDTEALWQETQGLALHHRGRPHQTEVALPINTTLTHH